MFAITVSQGSSPPQRVDQAGVSTAGVASSTMEQAFATEVDVERYLTTGQHDLHFQTWPGSKLIDRARKGTAALRSALITEVRRRSQGRSVPSCPDDLDTVALTRARVAPMVRGLFPKREQGVVLEVLARSVVFLTPASIETVLGSAVWLSTAWDLASLFLASVGAEPLSSQAPDLVGLSEETTCYVSCEYFRCSDPFADFIVHEAAHIFHNCKRSTIGLTESRTSEWLLPIAYARREMFAWACEAYTRILELGRNPAVRRLLLAELEHAGMPGDGRVDPDEYLGILREAVGARSGWKRILNRCSEKRQQRAQCSRSA